MYLECGRLYRSENITMNMLNHLEAATAAATTVYAVVAVATIQQQQQWQQQLTIQVDGSVRGPLKLIAYTKDLPSVVEEHNVDPYLYADGGQLNDHLLPSDITAAIPKMENCVDAVHKWCTSKRLQLNPSKIEVIWFGINVNLKKLQTVDLSLRVGADTIAPVDAVRDLGLILDRELWPSTSPKSLASATTIIGA